MAVFKSACDNLMRFCYPFLLFATSDSRFCRLGRPEQIILIRLECSLS